MPRLELHHVAGKCSSELTCTLCVGHHMPISNRQWCWDVRWNSQSNSEGLRASFIVQGVQELLVELHASTGIHDYRVLADSLSPTIRGYRERG